MGARVRTVSVVVVGLVGAAFVLASVSRAEEAVVSVERIPGESVTYVERPGGRVAVGVLGPGEGAPVVLVPGLGDTRGQYRVLAPALAAKGFRVFAMDLRGHGDSDTTFTDHSAQAASEDVLALVGLAGRPAVLVGNSFAGRAINYAAVAAPEQVRGLVLVAPFTRDHETSWGLDVAMRVMFARPWGAWAWGGYYKSLYPTRPPADLPAYVDRLTRNLAEPGRLEALASTLRSKEEGVDARVSKVSAPALVVMGSKDPDFKDPKAEAEAVAKLVHAEVVMVEGAGHYPHVEFPELANTAIVSFLEALPAEVE